MRAAMLLLAIAACSKSDGGAASTGIGSSTPGAAASGPREVLLEAWKKGGLTPSPLTPASVAVGKDCQSGTVGALDVLLCVFPSQAEAKQAEDAGLGWVGETTGASQAAGPVLVVVADRRKGDPSGRTINQMMKLAPR
jgi:hypothetical protein